MKKFLLPIIFLFSFFFLFMPRAALAQGTCNVTKVGPFCTVLPWDNNCEQNYETEVNASCAKCTCKLVSAPAVPPASEGCPGTALETALGCIPVDDPTNFIAWFLRWAIGIAGGIAFLLILYSGFQIMTSSGDPEKLKAGKELLTSAIAGLILIIFSVFLLRLIGVEILQIPGL